MGAGLDSPFAISVPTAGAVAAVRAVHARTTDRTNRHGCSRAGCGCDFSRHYRAAFPADVPLTSIYSKGDGVVRWESCVVPYARCVEVTGSHIGLAVNRKSYRVVAAALATRKASVPTASSERTPPSPPSGMHSGHSGSRFCASLASTRAITSRWISFAPS